MADAHTDESGAPPVTICCAASDGASVREAAEALVARGHQVELAVGVDLDQAVLTRAISALRGRGLYVLCRSHALDRNAVDELREILRTHDVPFGRTLTLAVDTQRPREVEERIVSVLRRMVTGRADGRPKAWGASTQPPEEDPDTTVRRPAGSPAPSDPTTLNGLGSEPENADPYARTSQIEVAYRGQEIVPPPYTGVEHTAVTPPPQAPAPAMPASLPSPAPAPMPSPASMPMPAMPASAASPLGASMGASTTAPPPGGGAGSLGGPLGASMPGLPMGGGAGSLGMSAGASMPAAPMGPNVASSMPSRPVPLFSPSGPMSAPPAMNDALSVYTPPPVSADEPSTADFDELPSGGRMGRALGSPAGLAMVLGGLAIVTLLGFGAFMLAGGDEDDSKATAAATSDAANKAATEAKGKPEAKADAKDGGAKRVDAKADAEKAGDAGSSDAKPEDAKPEDAKPEDAKPEDAKPEADAAPEPTPATELDADAPSRPRWAAAGDPGDALPARTFAPEDDPPEVIAALKSREVRALDVFLVAPERKGTLTFDQAVAYCQALEIAGLSGWRVPTIGELNAVATAKMLGKAIYWSATPGDSFGDLRLVVGTKKATTIVAVPKTWDGAKIACLRPRQP